MLDSFVGTLLGGRDESIESRRESWYHTGLEWLADNLSLHHHLDFWNSCHQSVLSLNWNSDIITVPPPKNSRLKYRFSPSSVLRQNGPTVVRWGKVRRRRRKIYPLHFHKTFPSSSESAWPSFGFSASGTPPRWPNLRLPQRPPYICKEYGR